MRFWFSGPQFDSGWNHFLPFPAKTLFDLSDKIKATMGIGPMTFSLRERRSATELNRLLTFLFHLSTLPYFLISSLSLFMLERFHGVGAAYKILVLGTPVRFWVEPPFCLFLFSMCPLSKKMFYF